MCEPISIGLLAAAGAAASLGGSVMSANASKASANAIAAQNQAEEQAQNAGFTQRMNASEAQTEAQTAAMQETMAARNTAANQMRAQQASALTDYQNTINAENTQAQTLRQTGDTAAQDLLQQTTAPALTNAQTAQTQQAATLLSPGLPQGPTPTDPSGGSNDTVASDPTEQAAAARRTAEAATNIRSYGGKIAQVASYDAPMQAVNLAVANNKTGIMPAVTADELLRSGSATRLLPSQVAYQGATGLGQAEDTLLQSKGQNALDAAALSYGNATNIANLTQSDADTIAQNQSAQAQANAKYQASLGNLVSGLGNLGLYGAGYYGGNPFKGGTPVTAATVTNHGA